MGSLIPTATYFRVRQSESQLQLVPVEHWSGNQDVNSMNRPMFIAGALVRLVLIAPACTHHLDQKARYPPALV